MVSFKTKGPFFKLYSWLPIIVLFISVLNEFDLNYLRLDYFSFNFPFILIFSNLNYLIQLMFPMALSRFSFLISF